MYISYSQKSVLLANGNDSYDASIQYLCTFTCKTIFNVFCLCFSCSFCFECASTQHFLKIFTSYVMRWAINATFTLEWWTNGNKHSYSVLIIKENSDINIWMQQAQFMFKTHKETNWTACGNELHVRIDASRRVSSVFFSILNRRLLHLKGDHWKCSRN